MKTTTAELFHVPSALQAQEAQHFFPWTLGQPARTTDQRHMSQCRALALEAGHQPLSCGLGMYLDGAKLGREPVTI